MNNPIKFAVSDYIERDLAWEQGECEKLGVAISIHQLKDAPAQEIVSAIGDADIALVNMARISSEVVSGLRKVKLIIRHGIGYDNVDVGSATEHGIIVANQATASSIDVAEHAIMLMFATYRKINVQRSIVESALGKDRYEFSPVYPLYRLEGKTLGIVGCGNIGSIIFRKMKSFGMNLLVVCDPYLSPDRMLELGISCTPLDEVLARSDILTIHVPLTDETHGMLNRDRFRRMKRTAVIINTSRGQVINTADLIEALREGVIAGAGLDVLDHEPPGRESELVAMKNVVLTPHLAWYSEEGGWDIRHMIMDDLKSFLRGKPPRHVVNPEVFRSPELRMKLT